jgi:hypothetical protein
MWTKHCNNFTYQNIDHCDANSQCYYRSKHSIYNAYNESDTSLLDTYHFAQKKQYDLYRMSK